MRWVTEQALAKNEHNASVELIDLRTISPWDSDMVISSVKKTGRCLIVHEAQRSGGFGGEISATIMDKALFNLKAPVERVTGFDIPPPYLKTEHYHLPDEARILDGLQKVLSS
jgi:pyruvate/2-oxoglutarate/acetoin dehydrogenase E1 component